MASRHPYPSNEEVSGQQQVKWAVVAAIESSEPYIVDVIQF